MCKLVWRGERETVKWGLAGETGMQWLPLITEELSGGRWMESIWPQGVEPGLVQQIGGRWIGAQYLRRQTCSKKLRAASGEREFSSAPKQLEQRAGWVILTANMYGNAYRGGLSASSHCLLPCSPCERGTVSLSISLMGKWSLGEKDSDLELSGVKLDDCRDLSTPQDGYFLLEQELPWRNSGIRAIGSQKVKGYFRLDTPDKRGKVWRLEIWGELMNLS